MTQQSEQPVYFLEADDGAQRIPVDHELLLGRESGCDVVLDRGHASRKHARLTPDSGGIWVEDLGSTNGTFVNGERISKPTLLQDGDELRGGENRFRLSVVESQPALDPDATLQESAADATLQVGQEAELFPAEEAASKQVDDEGVAGDSEAVSESAAAEAEAVNKLGSSAADGEPETSDGDAKAPPSWVMNNQQSVDGTAFISKDLLKDSLQNSNGKADTNETVAEPSLIGNSDPIMGVRFQLLGDENVQWEVGRAADADIMLNHESVSGAHAQILHENGRWKLVDLMSANGTYANGKKCLSGYLSSGDTVRFGGVECVFLLPESEEPEMEAQEEPASANSWQSRQDPLLGKLGPLRRRLEGLMQRSRQLQLVDSVSRKLPRMSIDPAAVKIAAIAFGATAAASTLILLLLLQFV